MEMALRKLALSQTLPWWLAGGGGVYMTENKTHWPTVYKNPRQTSRKRWQLEKIYLKKFVSCTYWYFIPLLYPGIKQTKFFCFHNMTISNCKYIKKYLKERGPMRFYLANFACFVRVKNIDCIHKTFWRGRDYFFSLLCPARWIRLKLDPFDK